MANLRVNRQLIEVGKQLEMNSLRKRKLYMNFLISMDGRSEFSQIGGTDCAPRGFPRMLHRRKRNCDQQRKNGRHNHQFNESEP